MKPLVSAGLVLAGTLASVAAVHACGKVTIADMNWNSATLIANVDRFILEHGYGCDAELVPGDTMPTGTSMTEKGEPDIAPELWSNSMKEALEKGVAEKRLRIAGKALSDGGEEGEIPLREALCFVFGEDTEGTKHPVPAHDGHDRHTGQSGFDKGRNVPGVGLIVVDHGGAASGHDLSRQALTL